MKPLAHSIRFWLIGTSILFSGITIDANTGRGFILLATPIIGLLVLIHLLTHARYRTRWLAGVFGFIFLSFINGSRPGSILLILISLILFEYLRDSQRGRYITAIDLRWLTVCGGVLALLATIDLLAGRVASLWTIYGEHENQFLDLPRLKLFFSEPSYLGVFSVATFFKLRGHPRFQKIALLVALLTQSLYAIAYFFVLMLRLNARLLMTVFIFSIFLVFFIAREEVSIFFLNSGLVRLVGLTLLENMGGFSLWVGHGLGAGDLALEGLFSEFGVETFANGFLFSLFYDVGLLGMLCLYLGYTRSLFDFILFNFLLLNFGIGSFLTPVLMYMGVSENKLRKHQAWRQRQQLIDITPKDE
jgi:hypothetical protein